MVPGTIDGVGVIGGDNSALRLDVLLSEDDDRCSALDSVGEEDSISTSEPEPIFDMGELTSVLGFSSSPFDAGFGMESVVDG